MAANNPIIKKADFIPYEGNENYIFVSYAHRDSEYVVPIIERMNAEGYRIWYDDGIAPGSEWPENIAEHLSNCAVALAFVSDKSIESANCRREVTYALTKNKPFLGIILRQTTFSPGMEMQLSAQECILKYHYPDEEAFYRKLFSSAILSPCKRKPEPIPVKSAPEEPVSKEPALSHAPGASVKTEAVPAEPAKAQKPVAEPVQEATKAQEPVAEPVQETAKVQEPVTEPVQEAAKAQKPVAEPVQEATKAQEPVKKPVNSPVQGAGSTEGFSPKKSKSKGPMKILLAILGVIIILIAGIIIFNNIQRQREKAEAEMNAQKAAAAIPREIFYGQQIREGMAHSDLSQAPNTNQTADGVDLELVIFPTSIEVNPDTPDMMKLEFQDKFEKTYRFAASYTFSQGVLNLFAPDGKELEEGTSPLTESLSFDVSLSGGNIYLNANDEYSYYTNAGTTENRIILQGTASSAEDIYEEIKSFDFSGSQSSENTPCQVFYENGGYTLDAVVKDLSDSYIVISSDNEMEAFNGYLQETARHQYYSFYYYNTWPYGFIIKDGNDYYCYQDPVMTLEEQ